MKPIAQNITILKRNNTNKNYPHVQQLSNYKTSQMNSGTLLVLGHQSADKRPSYIPKMSFPSLNLYIYSLFVGLLPVFLIRIYIFFLFHRKTGENIISIYWCFFFIDAAMLIEIRIE